MSNDLLKGSKKLPVASFSFYLCSHLPAYKISVRPWSPFLGSSVVSGEKLASVMALLGVFWCVGLLGFLVYDYAQGSEQPLSRIAIHRATMELQESASILALPTELGLKVTHSNFSKKLVYFFVLAIRKLSLFLPGGDD